VEGLMSDQLLKLGLYLAELRHKPYQYGEMDCNLFIVDWVDKITNSNWAADIRGKYSDAKGACRFAQSYTPAPEWLALAGYTQVSGQHRSGDVLTQKQGDYFTGWIVLMGLAYSVMPESGVVQTKIDRVEDAQHWRLK
jgi:hypothetical protein